MAETTGTTIITFVTLKGGVGKTTLSFNFGGMLAKRGKHILMVDADPQSNLTSNFNYDIFNEEGLSFKNIFSTTETYSPESIIIKSPIPELPTLDIIPNTMWSFLLDEELTTRSYREKILLNYFNEFEDFFRKYDYIIFDCNPGIGIVNQNVLTLTDHIILTTDPSVNGATGADLFIKMWKIKKEKSMPLKISGLIMNNMEATNISKELKKYLTSHELLSSITLNQTIPHTTAFKDAELNNVPLFMLKKSGSGIASAKVALERLLDEMFERGIL